MEVTIYINGQAVSVQVSLEVYHFLNEANHKDENLLHEQRRHCHTLLKLTKLQIVTSL